MGDPDPVIGTAWERGERLAKLASHHRTLLVLDGLEPLQNPPGPQEGRIRAPALQALLRELAAFNTGLCVITTRTPVADIADHERTSVLCRDLEQLSSDAGAKLLRALGVKGNESELRSASDEFDGHCLALTLMGSYLADAYKGDIRRRGEISARLADDLGQWRYIQMTDKLSAAMKIAERVHSLAQEQNDPSLMIGACNSLACTFHFLGDFEASRQYALRGVEIWRSGNVRPHAEDYYTPAVGCLCFGAMSEWYLGNIASCRANLEEARSLAKELNDTIAIAMALTWTASFAQHEGNPAEVDRLMSDLIELSTRHNFVYWLAVGSILRGWAWSASGDTAKGIPWIEQGIRDFRTTGLVLAMPYYLLLKAEALHLADRTSEALGAVSEAQALAEKFEQRSCCADLLRFRGVFLATLCADEAQIEASFHEAIRTAREQKSVSLEKRAEETYEEYRRQKAGASGVSGFRLPLW